MTSTLKSITLSCCAMFLLATANSWSQETGAPATAIEVRGTKDPDWKPYRTMLKGLDAFQANHSLAPQAELHFILRPVDPAASLEGVTLNLSSEDYALAIPITSDGVFDLPNDTAAANANAELVLNRKKKVVLWRPYIRTPGLPANQRRLGDLRLECSIIWAVEYDDIPFLIRNMFRLVGGPCKSTKIAVFFDAPRPLRSATIASGDRSEALYINPEQRTFLPPLGDPQWNDESIIQLEY